jgi:hypothetical protein
MKKYLVGIIVGLIILCLGVLFIVLIKQTSINKTPNQQTDKQKVEITDNNQLNLYFRNNIFTSPKVNNLDQFSLEVPQGWNISRFSPPELWFVEISKGDYALQIFKPYEGSICIYPGDKPYEGPAQNFDQWVNIQTNFGSIRMGRDASPQGNNKIMFRACIERQNTSDGHKYFWKSTDIGNIQYYVPVNYDEKMINEMNGIVQKIQLIK